MSQNMNAAHFHEASGHYITPRCRMVYPALLEKSLPKGETDPAKAKYQITLLFPKGADLAALVNAAEKTIADNISAEKRKTVRIKKPFIKTEEQPRFADLAEDYPVMVRASANYKPQVIRADTQPENDESNIYGGRWCRVSLNPYWYDHPTGGKGVSFGLQNVQLLEHDDPIGGGHVKAEDQFEPVGDNLEASTDTSAMFD